MKEKKNNQTHQKLYERYIYNMNREAIKRNNIQVSIKLN